MFRALDVFGSGDHLPGGLPSNLVERVAAQLGARLVPEQDPRFSVEDHDQRSASPKESYVDLAHDNASSSSPAAAPAYRLLTEELS
jgi:hypothetical protein